MTTIPNCGICDLRQQCKQSVIFCPECDECLCADCKEHHGLSKASKNHNTIPITEYMKIPSDMWKISEYCNMHKEKFQTFCMKHSCPCCRVCLIRNHDKCEDKVLLESVLQNVKNSTTINETENLIKEMLKTIDIIREDRNININDFTEQSKSILQDFRERRANINTHLDKLEKRLADDLIHIEENVKVRTRKLMAFVDIQQQELLATQNTLANLKKYATDLQTFCALKQIQNDTNSKDQYLHYLVENGTLERDLITCQDSSCLQDSFVNMQRFGTLVMEKRPSEIKIIRKKEREAQIVVANVPPKSVESISLSIQRKLTTNGHLVTGCLVLPNGTMAFSCYRKEIVRVLDPYGAQLFELKTGTYTFDMAYIPTSNCLAVTTGGSEQHCITIIDLNNKSVSNVISVQSYTNGVTLRNNNLYFCAKDKGLRMVNLNDMTVRDIDRRPLPWDAYVATFRDKLYVTNSEKHTVTCIDLQGQKQWEFKDENILSYPLGIDVDKHGNVHVVGNETHNIVIISPDGKDCRELMCTMYGLDDPCAIHCDRAKSLLLLANRRSTAALFDISM